MSESDSQMCRKNWRITKAIVDGKAEYHFGLHDSSDDLRAIKWAMSERLDARIVSETVGPYCVLTDLFVQGIEITLVVDSEYDFYFSTLEKNELTASQVASKLEAILNAAPNL